MIEVDWALCQRVGQVCGAGCHLREGNDHLATAVPCEGQGVGEGAGARQAAPALLSPMCSCPSDGIST